MFYSQSNELNVLKTKEIVVDRATVSSVTSKRIEQSIIVKVPHGLLKDENLLQQEFVRKLLHEIVEATQGDLSSIHHDIIIAGQNAVITGNLHHESIGQQLYVEIIPDENLSLELKKLNQSQLAILDDVLKLEQQIKNFEKQLQVQRVNNSWSRFEYIPGDEFQKRSSLWGTLENRFSEQPSNVVVLTGLGGAGKSSLALHWGYAQANRKDISKKRYEHIRWMRMDEMSKKASLDAWAKDLKITIDNMSTQDILVTIADKIQNSSWLLILDNVESYASIELWLNSLPKNIYQHILITTRDDRSCWMKPIKVGVFEPEEALTYIENIIKKMEVNISWSVALASDLAERLGYHPLALELALGQITYYEIPLDVYIDRLSLGLDSLKERNKIQGFEQLSNHTISTLWQIELEQLSFKAAHLLRFMSFIHPDQIRYELLANFQGSSCDRNTMDSLRAQSFIKKLSGFVVEQWSVHRLLQEVVRSQFLINHQFLLENFLNQVVSAYEKTYVEKKHEDDVTRCQEAILHAETLISYFPLFSPHLSRSLLINCEVHLLLNLGRLQRVLSLYTKAQETFTKILQLLENNPILFVKIQSKFYLEQGILFYFQGKYPEAKQNLQLALSVDDKNLLSTEFIVESKYMIGLTLLEEGNAAGAKAEFEGSLEIYRVNCGDKPDFYIANILRRLGDVCLQENNFLDADKYYKEALDMNYLVYGKKIDHPSIAATLHGLGSACLLQGKKVLSEALGYFTRSLKMKHAVYGPKTKHSNIAVTLHKLGDVYVLYENYIEAKKYYIDALTMKYDIYGRDANHSSIATTLECLGSTYEFLNDCILALKHYNEALAIYKAFSNEKYKSKINVLEEKIYSYESGIHAGIQKNASSNLNILTYNHYPLFAAIGMAAIGVGGAIAWRCLSKK